MSPRWWENRLILSLGRVSYYWLRNLHRYAEEVR